MSDAPLEAPVETIAPPTAGELMLVDGNSLAYRAFFALPDTISTADGFPTNALYGLAAMMMKVVTEERPSRVVVCWDAPGKTFRHEAYPEYKAGRAATPDLFREQSVHFRPLMEAFGFVNTELTGFEADDLIGTLARRGEEAGERVTILTSDRDTFQLVTDQVSVLATGRGVTDTTRYTPEKVVERYGIGPELMTDYRGLVGDNSDNLKGVPGIGEKTATQLIVKYGDLDAVLAHAHEQSPKRKENLIAAADDARQTRDLSVIETAVPMELELDDVPPLDLGPERRAVLEMTFNRWEFGSLARRLDELTSGPVAAAPVSVGIEVTPVECGPEELAMRLLDSTDAVALAVVDRRWAVCVAPPTVLVGDLEHPAALASAIARMPLICHDFKGLPHSVAAELVPSHDTMVAGYLLEPRRRGYDLAELAADIGIGVLGSDDPAVRAAVLTHAVAERQAEGMRREGLEPLFREVELPLVSVLADMERVGVALDTHRLGEIAHRVRDRADELRDQIWELAGGEFVIDSPKQLGHVLFEKLGLPTFRKGKTGFSTDRRVLKLLETRHPIIALIGEYRELTKLDGTYLSALPVLVDDASRLHTTFNQTVAETGRLSSVNPNLQNIPVRTAIGREIRGAFVAPEGWKLASFDYSQVELRILAHCSGEPTLATAFRAGEDVHRATAAEVFGMDPADIDRQTRDRAKAVNFGIVYGISAFGLSEQLNIDREEAQAYIDTYLARYPRVRSFIDSTIAAAAQDGYVTTLLGRRRPIPELLGRTVQQRNLGERLAVNTVIQGSAADIIKLAMVRAHAAIKVAGLRARIVLQIHDELLVEVPADEVKHLSAIVRDAMIGAYALDPPLEVDLGVGETWLEAKS